MNTNSTNDSAKFTAERCATINTLREYERVHAVYMNTSKFAANAQSVRDELKLAREAYLTAVKTEHPTWIVC